MRDPHETPPSAPLLQPRPRPRDGRGRPAALTFAPLAWLKLQFLCQAGPTEVGGFAVTAAADPLYVEDLATVPQAATPVTVAFDDAAVADHFDRCTDAGLPPGRVGRVWCHTHPGDSPAPSLTDEATFARAFGACDWAVMFVLSRTARTYARLAFAAGPGGAVELDVAVDWAAWPHALLGRPGGLAGLAAAWAAEYERNVRPAGLFPSGADDGAAAASGGTVGADRWGPADLDDLSGWDDPSGRDEPGAWDDPYGLAPPADEPFHARVYRHARAAEEVIP